MTKRWWTPIPKLRGPETRRACSCCGYLTMPLEMDTYLICPVCNWEDDPVQNEDPTFAGGANGPSLVEARVNFKRFGVCEEKAIGRGRSPNIDELPQ